MVRWPLQGRNMARNAIMGLAMACRVAGLWYYLPRRERSQMVRWPLQGRNMARNAIMGLAMACRVAGLLYYCTYLGGRGAKWCAGPYREGTWRGTPSWDWPWHAGWPRCGTPYFLQYTKICASGFVFHYYHQVKSSTVSNDTMASSSLLKGRW
jgi:hypothetical protein